MTDTDTNNSIHNGEYDILQILNESPITSPVSLNMSNLFTSYSAITPPEAFSSESYSPDMFPSSSELVDGNQEIEFSPSMLDLPQLRTPSEYHQLIVGIMETSKQSSMRPTTSNDWGDDANENAELCNHMDQYEQLIVKNAASDDWANNEEENAELNKHMDEYEWWGSDFDNINKLFLKKHP
ncbi:hypothetical protein AGLY_002697 [Aphis glycines]|uniref:Uncharacterized protein n=1 Tax=Aphis glycines TaxID=307491 RepID=A0A6G0U3I1_APHGL|nr:hypothetical protein AGLY_002697 [Aphis glycines]